MSQREMEELVSTLTPGEIAQLQRHLRDAHGDHDSRAKVIDFTRFSGVLELSEDPLEWQRCIRSEWR